MSAVSVIIVTLNRPDCVRRCLECLLAQQPKPDQIIVVDASPDDRTHKVVDEFLGVIYLRNENGYGRMTASRNIGLRVATGDIIAFLDDDAYARPGWLPNLLATYIDKTVGAVGGRALNNQPGEELQGVHEIGLLKPNGLLTGNFAADPGEIIEVDHMIGCNMSFRRSLLAELGGLREEYTGTEVREETDICLRVKRLGHKIVFNPDAIVDHVGAPQVKGRRFDSRYQYYAHRNHLVLLTRNFGLSAGIVWRFLGISLVRNVWDGAKKLAGSILVPAVAFTGTVAGLSKGIILLLRTGRDPIRRDVEAQAIRQALQGNEDTRNSPQTAFTPLQSSTREQRRHKSL